MRNIFLAICLFLMTTASQAQEHIVAHEEQHHEQLKGAHQLTLGLGHVHVSQGVVDGKREWLALPSWSVNYDYWLSNKWALGLQTDLIIETFVIEDNEGLEFERTRPLALVPVAIFKPGKRLALLGGVGVELEGEQNFMLTRFGLEYGFHIPGNWEVGAALVWDNKWNYYNSWGISFTFSKIWPRKRVQFPSGN